MTKKNERQMLIERIRHFPDLLETLVSGLTEAQLTTVYLDGEWTVAQNVHHIADSHMNSYIRCKLMATEDHPTLKPYDEAEWAKFPDAAIPDLSATLSLLRGLHARWTIFWETLPESAWQRTGYHPESGEISLTVQLQAYVAHGEAHLAQIRRTLDAAKQMEVGT